MHSSQPAQLCKAPQAPTLRHSRSPSSRKQAVRAFKHTLRCSAQHPECGSDASSTSTSRRAALAVAGAAVASLACPPAPVHASAAIVEGGAAPSIAGNSSSGALREYRMVARVMALRGSVPAQWPADFQAAMENYGLIALTQKTHLRDIYGELQGGSSSVRGRRGGQPTTADAVTVGDAWLQRVIAEGLVQPIKDARQQRWWSLLHPRWQQLVCRTGPSAASSTDGSPLPTSSGSSSSTSSSSNSQEPGMPDPRGEVWGAPYRWGCTLIAYNQRKLLRRGGHPVHDWSDLLQPELAGQIAFHDSPREVVGVALKTLGLSSFNASLGQATTCGLSEADMARRLQRLVQQVRVFSHTDHVRSMLAGDVLAIVGSSDDLLPLAERMTDLELVAPLSGTPLWADLWCIPANAAGGAEDGEPSPLLPSWFELGLQPVRSERSQGLRGGASPLLLPAAPAGTRARGGRAGACSLLQPDLSGSSQLDRWLPSEEVLQRSEFLLPLPDIATRQLYARLLQGAPAGS